MKNKKIMLKLIDRTFNYTNIGPDGLLKKLMTDSVMFLYRSFNTKFIADCCRLISYYGKITKDLDYSLESHYYKANFNFNSVVDPNDFICHYIDGIENKIESDRNLLHPEYLLDAAKTLLLAIENTNYRELDIKDSDSIFSTYRFFLITMDHLYFKNTNGRSYINIISKTGENTVENISIISNKTITSIENFRLKSDKIKLNKFLRSKEYIRVVASGKYMTVNNLQDLLKAPEYLNEEYIKNNRYYYVTQDDENFERIYLLVERLKKVLYDLQTKSHYKL
jgi:hypothetical protein